jgi:hypothetical protein
VKGVSHPDLLAARLVYKMLNFAFAGSVPAYPRLDALDGAVTKGARKKAAAPAEDAPQG